MVKEQRDKAEAVVQQMKDTYGNDTRVTVYNGRGKIKGTTMLFQSITYSLTKVMTPASCKLLLYFMTKAQWDNFVGCNVRTIAEDLLLTERTVIKSVKELKSLKIIVAIKDDDDRRRNVYMINPHQSWKGTVKKRNTVIKVDGLKNQMKLDFTKE